MKIAASSVQMSSSHLAFTRHEVHERLRMWTGNRPDFEGRERPLPSAAREPVTLSDAGKARQSAEGTAIDAAMEAADKDPMLNLLRAMIEMLTGRRVKIFDAATLEKKKPEANTAPENQLQSTPPAPNFGIEYDRHETLDESETTRFSAEGSVRTADGREIRFAIELEMARSYHEESNVSVRLGNAQKKDPLVINFAGSAVQLSDRRFNIDLDSDGTAEEARFVAPGSGFLVFDRNDNGRVDNGGEMFGATSGDGFVELASLDGDSNGWIDEADAAYSQLSVWTKAADGSDHLTSLADSGVGAIATGRVATPFELRDAANTSLGAIRSSGVYLRENGSAGTVQQIDLSV